MVTKEPVYFCSLNGKVYARKQRDSKLDKDFGCFQSQRFGSAALSAILWNSGCRTLSASAR
jgi:hypothetical protein